MNGIVLVLVLVLVLLLLLLLVILLLLVPVIGYSAFGSAFSSTFVGSLLIRGITTIKYLMIFLY